MSTRIFLIVVFFSAALSSFAHQTSQAFLNISEKEGQIEGRWDIALKDLNFAVDLDRDRNAELSWGEIKSKFGQIDAELFKELRIYAGDQLIPCTVKDHKIEDHLGANYLVIYWEAKAPKTSQGLKLTYDFFYEIDPTHRALLSVTSSASTRTTILTEAKRNFEITSAAGNASTSGFLKEGVWHIWTGFDHILFLLALLLPAVLLKEAGQNANLIAVLKQVAKVVTAFTIAHSITLSLAVCGVVFVPGRIVEPIIGLSVLIAALNNLYPIWREKGWIVAFGFGLIHGFGFAEALKELGLAPGSLANCLFLFNLGVEIGQLAIVAVFVPVAFALRESWLYRGLVFRYGSVAISLVAGLWIVERVFNVAIF
jgi:hypothetical protein